MSCGSKLARYHGFIPMVQIVPNVLNGLNSLNVLNPGSIDNTGNDSTGSRVIAT